MRSLSKNERKQKLIIEISTDKYEYLLRLFKIVKSEMCETLKQYFEFFENDLTLDVVLLKNGKYKFKIEGIIDGFFKN